MATITKLTNPDRIEILDGEIFYYPPNTLSAESYVNGSIEYVILRWDKKTMHMFLNPQISVTVPANTGAVDLAEQLSSILNSSSNIGSLSTQLADVVTNLDDILLEEATEAKQDIGNASLSSIDGKMDLQATEIKQDAGNLSLTSIDTKLSDQATASKQDILYSAIGSDEVTGTTLRARIKSWYDAAIAFFSAITTIIVSGKLNTRSAESDALISAGNVKLDTVISSFLTLATEAKQDAGNLKLDTIITNTSDVSTASKQDSLKTAFDAFVLAASTSAKQDALKSAFDAFVLAASTSALQTSANSKLDTIITNTNSVSTSTLQTSSNTKLDSIISNTNDVSTATKQDSLKAAFDAFVLLCSTSALQTSANTKLDTINTSLSGISTAANQSTTNTKLDNVISAFANLSTSAKQDILAALIGDGSGSDSTSVNGWLKTISEGVYVTPRPAIDQAQIQYDLSSKQRVTEEVVLGHYQNTISKNPDDWSEVLVGAAGSGITGFALPLLYINANTLNSHAIRQTRQWHPAFIGVSNIYEFTVAEFIAVPDCTKRFGCYSSDTSPYTTRDGIYFESGPTLTDYSLNIDKGELVTLNTVKIERADWDDKLDGTGASGIDMDAIGPGLLQTGWETLNTFGIEYTQFGAVRFLLKYGKTWHIFHTFEISAQGLGNVGFANASQPIRYEIFGNAANFGNMFFGGASVRSGIHLPLPGIPRIATSGTFANCNTATTVKYALCGIRQDSAYHRNCQAYDVSISVNSLTAAAWSWELHINPTLANALTWSNVGNNLTETGVGDVVNAHCNTTVSGDGIIIARGEGGGLGGVNETIPNTRRIGSVLALTREQLVLVVIPRSANLDIVGTINFKEFG